MTAITEEPTASKENKEERRPSFMRDFSEKLNYNLFRERGFFPTPVLPRNIFTGKPYQEQNMLRLAAEGHPNPQYATFNQIVDAGGRVKKGEHGIRLQYFRDTKKIGGEVVRLEKPECVTYTVFHIDQTEGLERTQKIPMLTTELAEKFIQQLDIVDSPRTSSPTIDPTTNTITMPESKRYPNRETYLRDAIEQTVALEFRRQQMENGEYHDAVTPDLIPGTPEAAQREMRTKIAAGIVCDALELGAPSGNNPMYKNQWARMAGDHPMDICLVAKSARRLAEHVGQRYQIAELAQDRKDRDHLIAEGKIDGEVKIASHRTYINVPAVEWKVAQSLGAQYDHARQAAFVEAGDNLNKYSSWLSEKEVGKTNYATPEMAFAGKLKEMGFILEGDPVMDGDFHRAKTVGDKSGERSGSYKGFADGIPCGVATNFRTRDQLKWIYKGELELSPDKKQELYASMDIKKAERAEEITKKHISVAKEAEKLLEKLVPETKLPPYLKEKGIDSVPAGVIVSEGKVYVPTHDADGKVWGIQTIHEDGTKSMMPKQRMEGLGFVVGGGPTAFDDPKVKVIVACEGFSTAATLNKALDQPILVAFGAGNLHAAIDPYVERHPDKARVIVADDDRHLANNPNIGKNIGFVAACEAAEKLDAKVVTPLFPKDENSNTAKLTDFNDLAVKTNLGLEGVKRQVRPVLSRAESQHREKLVNKTVQKSIENKRRNDKKNQTNSTQNAL